MRNKFVLYIFIAVGVAMVFGFLPVNFSGKLGEIRVNVSTQKK